MYSLYNEEYEFPERMVALLFVTGFMSAALTAPFVGAWADQQYEDYSITHSSPLLTDFCYHLADAGAFAWRSA